MSSSKTNGGDQNTTLRVPDDKWKTRNDTQSESLSTYPPSRHQATPSYNSYESSDSTLKPGSEVSVRYVSRTPSPTPSEDAALKRKGVIDWKAIAKWRFWIRREWLWYYVALIIILIVVILVTVYDKEIVHALEPTANKIRDLPAGWLIPIAIFFVISFPPLFGHEILAILVGLVWGLWVGFAITSAGTFIGEVGNFYAFKYLCRARGEKLEKSKLQYACLARIVREGGFRVALVARYSAIPGHFTTAIFSTCGMGIWVFSLAAILSLPKQFIIVYIGVVLEQEGDGVDSPSDKKNKIIRNVVLVITIIVTALAMWYLTKKMDAVKHEVVRERRKARQAKLEANLSYDGSYTGVEFGRSDVEADGGSSFYTVQGSEMDLPLNPGKDTQVLAPKPLRPNGTSGVLDRVPTFRTEGGGGYSFTGERYGTSSRQSDGRLRQGSDGHEIDAWDTQDTHDTMKLPPIRPSTPLLNSVHNLSLSEVAYRENASSSSVQVNDPFASSETLVTGSHRATPNTSSSRSSQTPVLSQVQARNGVYPYDDDERTPMPYQSTPIYAPPPGPPPGYQTR